MSCRIEFRPQGATGSITGSGQGQFSEGPPATIRRRIERLATALAVCGLVLTPVSVAAQKVSAVDGSSASEQAAASYDCQAPYAMPYDLASVDQVGADAFSWQSFLALNVSGNPPQWTTWRTTGDLIDCNQTELPANGRCFDGFHYPEACTKVKDFRNYQVLDQVGKVDDGLFQAEFKGLSASPVLTAEGTFLRYSIMLSPPLTSWLLGQDLQEQNTLDLMQQSMRPVAFLCSDPKAPGSNLQSVIVKLAWMETPSARASDFYTQDLLVYTPPWRSSTGQETCVKQSMSLVGMHIARKTVRQPSWIWATFEHRDNAPDCTALPGVGDGDGGGGPSTACPSTVSKDWNFYPASCQKDGVAGPCQRCNTSPLPNGSGRTQDGSRCINPGDQARYEKEAAAYAAAREAWVAAGRSGAAPTPPAEAEAWCLDLGPATTSGVSRLCRQVGPSGYYPAATSWDDTPPNKACRPKDSVWSNYHLISTQFSVADYSTAAYCSNVQEMLWRDAPKKTFPVVQHGVIRPLVSGLDGDDRAPRPFMANTSMESYERSSCMGCHSKSTIEETINGKDAFLPTSKYEPKSPGTDFIYFLGLEVSAFEPKTSSSAPVTTSTASSAMERNR